MTLWLQDAPPYYSTCRTGVPPPPLLLTCYGGGTEGVRGDACRIGGGKQTNEWMFCLYGQPSFYRGYKPAFYLFVPMQMFYKMALWVTVAFLAPDSTLKLALLALLTTLRLLFHMVYEPNADFSNNLFDRAILTLTWLFAFGSMVSSNVKMHLTHTRYTGGFDGGVEAKSALRDDTTMNDLLGAIVTLAYLAVVLLFLRSVAKCVCRRSQKCRNRWNGCCCARRCQIADHDVELAAEEKEEKEEKEENGVKRMGTSDENGSDAGVGSGVIQMVVCARAPSETNGRKEERSLNRLCCGLDGEMTG